jgi:hypothetical protein
MFSIGGVSFWAMSARMKMGATLALGAAFG